MQGQHDINIDWKKGENSGLIAGQIFGDTYFQAHHGLNSNGKTIPPGQVLVYTLLQVVGEDPDIEGEAQGKRLLNS